MMYVGSVDTYLFCVASCYLLLSSEVFSRSIISPSLLTLISHVILTYFFESSSLIDNIFQSKVRTTGYHEIGGGNAANTATAMARLSKAEIFSNCPYRVKLCTKLGDDSIGQQCIEDLQTLGVDITSPLFLVGAPGSTTGLTNVIVSDQEHTRTCIHTPGTCGELTVADVEAVHLDEVFFHVHHLHTDGRHTEAALRLAREAHNRGITVSIDVEKDRHTESLDALIEEADLVFTNAGQIEAYLNRLMRAYENKYDLKRWKEPDIVAPASSSGILQETDLDFYAHALKPSSFFTRKCRRSGKEVVITRGEQGVVGVVNTSVTIEGSELGKNNASTHRLEVEKTQGDIARMRQTFSDGPRQATVDDSNISHNVSVTADYLIGTAGVLSNVKVVDTTGAGDSFIGGFLLLRFVTSTTFRHSMTTCLQFGSWVGGRKLQGFGARGALPTATDVDTDLGTTNKAVAESLTKRLSPFRFPSQLSNGSSMPLVASWESFVHEDHNSTEHDDRL